MDLQNGIRWIYDMPWTIHWVWAKSGNRTQFPWFWTSVLMSSLPTFCWKWSGPDWSKLLFKTTSDLEIRGLETRCIAASPMYPQSSSSSFQCTVPSGSDPSAWKYTDPGAPSILSHSSHPLTSYSPLQFYTFSWEKIHFILSADSLGIFKDCHRVASLSGLRSFGTFPFWPSTSVFYWEGKQCNARKRDKEETRHSSWSLIGTWNKKSKLFSHIIQVSWQAWVFNLYFVQFWAPQ